MKRIVVLASVLAAFTTSAQPTPQPAMESEFTYHLGKTGAVAAQAVKPNEIVVGRTTYSGIAVEAVKMGHPLQLINPLAPPQYGAPEDNVMPDSFKGRPTSVSDSFFGQVLRLKIFSIDF